MTKTSLLDLSQSDLKNCLKKEGFPTYTASQIKNWIYTKNCVNFQEMSSINKENRTRLEQTFTILPFNNIKILPSKDKSAIKYIFECKNNQPIESVVIKEKSYLTLCISSQAGCPVNCKFCLTGYAGFKQQLSIAEIVGQLLYIRHDGHPISRIVFMGMGEPLLNYNPVMDAIDQLTDPTLFNISQRKITVSTAGIKKGIQQLIEDKRALNLAFSVGCANPIKRIKIMPLEKNNPITDIARLLFEYQKQHNRKLTLEYTLLNGVNDSYDDINELGNLAIYLNAKVNLINLNPHPHIPFEPVPRKTLKQRQSLLKSRQIPCTIRDTKGQDITAACGQLGESLLPPV